MAQTTRHQDRGMGVLFAVLTAVAAFLLATAAIVAQSGSASTSLTASTPSGPMPVTLNEFTITPAALTAAPGDVKLTITNRGTQVHNLEVAALNKKSPDVAPGASLTFDLGTVAAGTYPVICAIPGHADAGMKATLTVGDGAGSSAAASGSMPGMAMPASGSSTTNDATIDFNASPDPAFTARDPSAPAPLTGTVHEVTIEASENVLAVAPWVTQQMWTFNLAGQAPTVPGPILRGRIGDTFKVTLVNKGTVEHSIDFHASKVAWNDSMRSIKPGESLVYEFTANYAGAFMYHCGTAPALHHIGNGMYGVVIVDPPVLAPVDHEYVLVQSELYLGPQGEPGDLAKMKDDAYDAVVFNGYANQYKFSPIRVEPDQRVRVWVVDAGPSSTRTRTSPSAQRRIAWTSRNGGPQSGEASRSTSAQRRSAAPPAPRRRTRLSPRRAGRPGGRQHALEDRIELAQERVEIEDRVEIRRVQPLAGARGEGLAQRPALAPRGHRRLLHDRVGRSPASRAGRSARGARAARRRARGRRRGSRASAPRRPPGRRARARAGGADSRDR